MKARVFITFLSVVLFFGAVQAQPGWNWPDDEEKANKAKEKNALYGDALKAKDFRNSANHLSWLLVNTPNLNKSIYIKGYQVYDGLAGKETDDAKKLVYQDSALLMYDLRIQYFNEEASVLNRKAWSAYKYQKSDKSKYADLFALFKQAVKLNGNKTWPNNLLAYMDVTRRYQKSGAGMSNEEILDIFGEIESILVINMQNTKSEQSKEKLQKIKDQVENMLTEVVEVDCAFISGTLAPKFQTEPTLNLAKTILRLSIAGKCLGEVNAAIDAAKYIFDNDQPEYALAKLIAGKCYEQNDLDCAENYYEQAAELTEDNEQEADANLSIANIKLKRGQKSSAREYARKALAVDPGNSEAAIFIGNLYMNSYNDCKLGKDPVQDRAIFIAAYNWYSKAGNAQGMSKAKEQFPSMEDIFTWNYEVGQSISIGCWVNESVSIKKRD